MLVAAHSNLLISSLYLTGAASNPIVAQIIERILGIKVSFLIWTRGALLPFIVAFTLLPILFSKMFKPRYDGQAVVDSASSKLASLSKITNNEIKLCLVMFSALILWMLGNFTHFSESFVAFLALLLLLYTNILNWNDISSNNQAWDTFVWLSGMIVIAQELSKLGISKFIGSKSAIIVGNITNSPILGALYLGILYFYSMFMFSSITGHAIALAEPFLQASVMMNAPKWLISSLIMYFSPLGACLTSFSTGSSVLYFGLGFFDQKEWIKIGTLVSIMYICIYSTVGLAWWKFWDTLY